MFDVLKCDSYGFLEVAPWLPCSASTAQAIFGLAISMIVVFSLGQVVLAAILLYRNRNTLKTPETRQYIGFLYIAYREQFFWWEVPSFLRRLLIISLISFLPPDSVSYGMSIGATLICLIILQQWIKPYRGQLANWMELFALGSLLLLFIANQYLINISALEIGSDQSQSLQAFLSWYDVAVSLCFLVALLTPLWKSLNRRIRRWCHAFESTNKEFGFDNLSESESEEDHDRELMRLSDRPLMASLKTDGESSDD
jgi:hypothetical protein